MISYSKISILLIPRLEESYSAWCRHDGYHTTAGKGFRDWNHELITAMNVDMQDRWQLLKQGAQELFQRLLENVEAKVEDLKKGLPSRTWIVWDQFETYH